MDIKKQKTGLPEGADPVFGNLFMARDFVKKNRKAVTVGIAVLLAAVIGIAVHMWVREADIRKAQEIFGIGAIEYSADNFDGALVHFVRAATEFGGTPVGAMSAFMAGSIYLQNDAADEAVRWFQAALRGGRNGFVRGQAHEGLAAAYEMRGDIRAAIPHLERALREVNITHRHPAIRWRLALMKMDTDKQAALAHCKALVSDTTAAAEQFHQRADNLIAALNAQAALR